MKKTVLSVLVLCILFCGMYVGGARCHAEQQAGGGLGWKTVYEAITDHLTDVEYTGGRFVAVGQSGTLQTSVNGLNWTKADVGYGELNCVAGSGNRIVVGGDTGRIAVTDDGNKWKTYDLKSNWDIEGMVWDGRRFVAAGSDNVNWEYYTGLILTSYDGHVWTETASGISEPLSSIAWNGSRYVTIGYDGGIFTSDDGYSWQEAITGNEYYINDIIWSGRQFVAVGENGAVLRSQDGINWTLGNCGYDIFLSGVMWNGREYFAVCYGGIILRSKDAVTWKAVRSGATSDLAGVAGNGEVYIIVGDNGMMLTSEDGTHWENRQGRDYGIFYDIACNDKVFVTVSDRGDFMVSFDGENWMEGDINASERLLDVVWTGDCFVALSDTGIIYGSYNGMQWRVMSKVETKAPYEIFYGNGRYFITTWSGTIITSSDLEEWTEQNPAGIKPKLEDIVWNGNLFVAVGEAGIVLTSYDGISWVKQELGTSNSYERVVWTGQKFLAVGRGTPNLVSTDGINWDKVDVDPDVGITEIVWTGQGFVGIGARGNIFCSEDGIEFTLDTERIGKYKGQLAWNGERLVAVGIDSGIMTAVPGDIIKVKVNGRPLTFDVSPTIVNGKTLVPLRAIFEALGAEIFWDGATGTVTGTKGDVKVSLTLESREATVNGRKVGLEVPATNVDGRTLVPARFIAESLGAQVGWDDASRTVLITCAEAVEPPLTGVEKGIEIALLSLKDETIYIRNILADSVDLTGWRLMAKSSREEFAFPDGYVLGAGETMAVTCGDDGIVSNKLILEWTEEKAWNKKADTALLENSNGIIVALYYGDAVVEDYNLFNNSLEEFKNLQAEVLPVINNLNQLNYDDINVVHMVFNEIIIPVFEECKEILESVSPETAEVKEIHKLYGKYTDSVIEGAALLVKAIENQDADDLKHARRKFFDASEYEIDIIDNITELMKGFGKRLQKEVDMIIE